jgi:hypothetical protein
MWPYTKDEQAWLDPAAYWAKQRLLADRLPTPANDDEGTENMRPSDPRTFLIK